MSRLGKWMAFFPLFQCFLILTSLIRFAEYPGIWSFLKILFSVYGIPLLAFKLHSLKFPIQTGLTRISDPGYSPWWGAYQIQLLLIACPAFESVLQLVPGLYSAWLRAWGSSVGHEVYWTPTSRVHDRSLVVVGDRVTVGYGVDLIAHVIKRSGERLILYVKEPQIGSDVFLGAQSRFAPGSVVRDGADVPFEHDVGVNETF